MQRSKRNLALLCAFLVVALSFCLSNLFGGVQASSSTYTAAPLGSITQPAKGSTYTDPTFGTKVLRLTDSSDGGSATVAYSYWPTFNSNSSKLIIALDFNPYLYNFNANDLTFQKIGPLFNSDSMQFEGLSWSASDTNTIYGVSGSNSSTLLRAYNVSTKQFTIIHDFTAAGELPVGTPRQMSKARSNDRYFSFHWYPAGSSTVRYAVVYDKQLNKTYLFDVQASYGMASFDECRLDRDGQFLTIVTGKESYVWQFATQSASQRTVISYNGSERSGGHYDLGSGTLVHSDLWGNNGNRVIKSNLNNPASWSSVFDSGVTDWASSQHISMLGPNDTWALVTTETKPSDYNVPFTNEIFLAKTDGSGSVLRLVHPNTSNNTYENLPFANMSPDGRFVAYNSDWNGGHCDVYIAAVPAGIWGATSTPVNPTVQATASVSAGIVPLSVIFNSTASSPNGSISTYSWDFGDGTNAQGASVSHSYPLIGTFTAVLTVTDSAGKTATSSVSINVTAALGVPNASFTTNVTSGNAPLAVSFNASGSTSPNGLISSYSWNYGDGSTGSGANSSHTYASTGKFTATLTVADLLGKSATSSKTISVSASSGGNGSGSSSNGSDGSSSNNGNGSNSGTTTTVSFTNNDGNAASLTYDTSITSSYPTYTIDTSFDGRVGGPNGCATLIAMPNIIGTGTGQIPPNAIIVSATLSVGINGAQPLTIGAQRILDPDNLGMWASGSTASNYNVAVAYGYRDANNSVLKRWSNSASNISSVLAPADSSVGLVGNEVNNTRVALNIKSAVQAWANGETNQGVAITGNISSNYISIYDSQYGSPYAPVLTVQYTLPLVTTTINLYAGDGNQGSVTTDVTISAASPNATMSTTTNNKLGGNAKNSLLIAFPSLIGTGLGQVPAGAKIVSAKLTFTMCNSKTMSLNIGQVLDANNKGMWSSSDATGENVGASYNNRNSAADIAWSNAAGNISQSIYALTPVDISAGQTSVSIDVTSSIAAWAAGAVNQGWWISTTSPSQMAICDSSNKFIARRPVLTITYSK